MSSALGSIPPPLASGFPPAYVGRIAPPSLPRSAQRHASAVRRVERAMPAVHPPVPARAPLELAPQPIAASPQVAVAPAPRTAVADFALTAIVFRPNGGAALTLRITPARCVAGLMLAACTMGAALAAGWVLGEWTALLLHW